MWVPRRPRNTASSTLTFNQWLLINQVESKENINPTTAADLRETSRVARNPTSSEPSLRLTLTEPNNQQLRARNIANVTATPSDRERRSLMNTLRNEIDHETILAQDRAYAAADVEKNRDGYVFLTNPFSMPDDDFPFARTYRSVRLTWTDFYETAHQLRPPLLELPNDELKNQGV